METTLTVIAIVSGFASAGCWLKASVSKVTREQAVKKAEKVAERTGEPVQYPTVSYNGLDPYASIVLQSKWNAAGASLAALAVAAQAVVSLV